MADQRECSISYLKAVWPDEVAYEGTLQQALELRIDKDDLDGTRTGLRTGLAQVLRYQPRPSPSRLLLQIVAWTDREPASTVRHDSADLDTARPGFNWDFLDGAGTFLIYDNHCLLMPSGLLPKTMEQYLRNILPLAARGFRLVPVADTKLIERIISEGGVKMVGLDLTGRRDPDRTTTRIWDELRRSLFSRIEDVESVGAARNVKAQLVVKVDSRMKDGLDFDEFGPVARDIVDQCSLDEFELVTAKGNRIRRGELILKKTGLKVDATGKTVHHNSAWEHLENYLTELIELGIMLP